MLRNRSLQVKMVKDDNVDYPSLPIDYNQVAKIVTKSVSTCLAVYVGMDIVRRVVIYAISAKF